MPLTLDENGQPVDGGAPTPPPAPPPDPNAPAPSPLAFVPPALQAALQKQADTGAASDAGARTLPLAGREPAAPFRVFPHHWYSLTQSPTPGEAPPAYSQAAQGVESGTPGATKGMTKLGKIFFLANAVMQGATAGSTQPTFGTGWQAARAADQQQQQFETEQQGRRLQNQMSQQALKYLPLEQAWKMRQMQDQENLRRAQTKYFGAGVDLRDAQADALTGYKKNLSDAQEEAAHYKVDPNVGLVDLRTQKPVDAAGQATLSAAEADALGGAGAGHQEGERVSLKIKNTANELANRGIHTVTANGHVYSVNNQMEKLHDWGTATPVVTMGMQLGPAANPNSQEFQDAVDFVGSTNGDLQSILSRFGRNSGAAISFVSQLRRKYPNYFQGNYKAEAAAQQAFTSGTYSQKLTAISTAREHSTVLTQLAKELDNGNVRAFNALGNAIDVEFGSDKVTNFNLAKQLYSGEIGQAISAGGGSMGERQEAADNINAANSWTALSGALRTADALLAGKQKALRNTYDLGRQGQPNFGQGSPTPAKGGAAGGETNTPKKKTFGVPIS